MTPPKKWFLQLANAECSQRDLVLANNDGLMKKPKAAESLGNVLNVSFLHTCNLNLIFDRALVILLDKLRNGATVLSLF